MSRTLSRRCRPSPNQAVLSWHVPKYLCTHRQYGLTCHGFDLMRWRAAGRCEICGADESTLYKSRIVIDHDHRLGCGMDHVRGLICPKCNAHMKYVDNGFRKPTRAQLMYIYNAWFWEWLPADRLDEPWFPPKPKDGGCDSTYFDSPKYRRHCLRGGIENHISSRWPCPPPQVKLGREAILRWETCD